MAVVLVPAGNRAWDATVDGTVVADVEETADGYRVRYHAEGTAPALAVSLTGVREAVRRMHVAAVADARYAAAQAALIVETGGPAPIASARRPRRCGTGHDVEGGTRLYSRTKGDTVISLCPPCARAWDQYSDGDPS